MARVKPARARAYGVMVRPKIGKTWMWLRPDGGCTDKPVDAAGWHGPGGEAAAYEAAKFISKNLPGLECRVTRKPTR